MRNPRKLGRLNMDNYEYPPPFLIAPRLLGLVTPDFWGASAGSELIGARGEVLLSRQATLHLGHVAKCSSRTTGSNSRFGADLQPLEINRMEMVDLTFTSWNRLTSWLGMVQRLRSAA